MNKWRAKPWLLFFFVAIFATAFYLFDRQSDSRPQHFVAIAGISVLEKGPQELLEQNDIDHFIAVDIALGMATLYCSPRDTDEVRKLINSLSDEKEHYFYMLDQPYEPYGKY